MLVHLAITPSGGIKLLCEGESPFGTPEPGSGGEILLALARQPSLRLLSDDLRFLYRLAEAFMQSLTSQVEAGEWRIPIKSGLFEDLVAACPPVRGSEYLNVEVFARIWAEASSAFRKDCGIRPVRDYLEEFYPAWADAGRVYLHIAENKTDQARPFSVLLTYSVRDADKARLQHKPLGLVLSDAGKASDGPLVASLLRVIARAATVSPEFARLHADRHLYRAFNLAPSAAYNLINDFPAIESTGISCKVPEYWEKGRPPKAQVAVTFKTGPKGPSSLVDGMLAFNVGVVLGKEELSEEEIAALLAAEEPLVSLRGRWVEVSSDRLSRLLGRWREAQKLAGESGMSFGEALRWSSGLQGVEGEGKFDQADAAAGVSFRSDDHLKDLLARLRNPDANTDALVAEALSTVRAELRPYQQKGVSWLLEIARLGMGGCLADDMGLGKTLQVISLLTVDKAVRKPKRPSLLIVPASLIGNWLSEIEKFSPTLRVLVMHSSAGTAVSQQAPNLAETDLVITTYGMITRPTWMNELAWNFVVADEAQAVKNPGTKQSKAVRALQAASRFALTGTPVENNLTDLWSVFDFVVPGLLGSKQGFAHFVKQSQEGSPDFSKLKHLVSPWLLRRKKSDKNVIADLPDKTEVKTYCFLSPKQAVLYQKQVEQAAAAIAQADGISRKGIIFSTILRLKQICNHPSQREGDSSFLSEHSGKFQRLAELCAEIAERQEKVLVFTQFRELTDILAHELELVFRRPGLVLHGDIAVKDRRNLVNKFQAEDGPPFFVLSVKAGGTGLNLTAASHVIHFDRWWNPAVENQATDRAYRIGQKRNVLVHKFICQGTIEDSIDQLIESKKALSDDIVEGTSEVNLTGLSDDELFDLMRFRS